MTFKRIFPLRRDALTNDPDQLRGYTGPVCSMQDAVLSASLRQNPSYDELDRYVRRHLIAIR